MDIVLWEPAGAGDPAWPPAVCVKATDGAWCSGVESWLFEPSSSHPSSYLPAYPLGQAFSARPLPLLPISTTLANTSFKFNLGY